MIYPMPDARYLGGLVLILLTPASLADDIDRAALQHLIDAAEKSNSTALVVWQDGKPLVEKWFNGNARPIESMSATKSIVNLAIGRLVTARAEPGRGHLCPWDQGFACLHVRYRAGAAAQLGTIAAGFQLLLCILQERQAGRTTHRVILPGS